MARLIARSRLEAPDEDSQRLICEHMLGRGRVAGCILLCISCLAQGSRRRRCSLTVPRSRSMAHSNLPCSTRAILTASRASPASLIPETRISQTPPFTRPICRRDPPTSTRPGLVDDFQPYITVQILHRAYDFLPLLDCRASGHLGRVSGHGKCHWHRIVRSLALNHHPASY